MRQLLLLLLLTTSTPHVSASSRAAFEVPPTLSEAELSSKYTMEPFAQPTWQRDINSPVQAILQRAAVLHQEGSLGAAVEEYKKAIRKDGNNVEACEECRTSMHTARKAFACKSY